MSTRSSAHLLFGFQLDDMASLPKEFGCDTVFAGSDYHEESLFLAAIENEAGVWGDPLQLNLLDLLGKEADARKRLADYCTKHGIAYKSRPGTLLLPSIDFMDD